MTEIYFLMFSDGSPGIKKRVRAPTPMIERHW